MYQAEYSHHGKHWFEYIRIEYGFDDRLSNSICCHIEFDIKLSCHGSQDLFLGYFCIHWI